MYILHGLGILCLLQFAFQVVGLTIRGQPKNIIRQETGQPLQNLVTWDDHSLFVRGERILFYSGEFHPFRLPVTDLWLDVFQKIKSLGYNGVSFYIDWALLEGTEGTIRADGVFALEPFFDAASEAGIYLLARPGPYINAEVSGGGFPGWLGRIKGTLRTNATDFLSATDLYIKSVGQKIAQAQITNGGPIILYQVENEYTYPAGNIVFPNLNYFDYVINQAIDVGITIPVINNDAGPLGYFAPGNSSFGNVTVDVYGHDSYPLGFDCSNPNVWPNGNLPTNFRQLHNRQSPNTPYSIIEFQGGSFDPWGGPGFGQCNKLINSKFERVFYKNNWAAGVTFYNQYMIFGGTNWGNLGHPGGYTSYDYAAVIAEDRSVAREKYSEAKLQANFLQVSPSYLTSVPNPQYVNGSYADTDAIATTALFDIQSNTNMYVIRHAAYNTNDSTSFKFTVSTSIGNITIPQATTFSSTLTLDGRDSKVLVTDYKVDNINLIYSSAEIFTWKTYGSKTILVLYGDAGETHEIALPSSTGSYQTSGSKVVGQAIGNTTVVQWQVTPEQQMATLGNLTVYLLWRNDAYNWWNLQVSSSASNYSSKSKDTVIAKGPYFLGTAEISNGDLYLTGEINATTTLEIISAPAYNSIYFNSALLNASGGAATLQYETPQLNLPDLSSLTWNSIDTLPELSPSYSDSAWPVANHTTTNNPLQPSSPYVLYASDYGFHTGPLLYRGHFTSPASSSSQLTLNLSTQGGYAYGYQVYLNQTLIHSYAGVSTAQNNTASIPLPANLQPSSAYTFTIVIDHTGLNENFNPGYDSMKSPRGILSYNLTSNDTTSSPQTLPISWKITGNLGGEAYQDVSRGPLNEGGLYFERMGYHLPGAPTNTTTTSMSSPSSSSDINTWTPVLGGPIASNTTTSSSSSSISSASASASTSSPSQSASRLFFYSTKFTVSLPSESHSIPLQFTFTNTTSSSSSSQSPTVAALRANLYINGWQFGKYINSIGPQVSFPVPEGILDYKGDNYLGVYLWDLGGAEEEDGAMEVVRKLAGLKLEQSSTSTFWGVGGKRRSPGLSYGEVWRERVGAY